MLGIAAPVRAEPGQVEGRAARYSPRRPPHPTPIQVEPPIMDEFISFFRRLFDTEGFIPRDT
jgi:hypothetical protein